MKDTISQACVLASTYQCAYNPGFPLTFGYRPVTTAHKYKDSMGGLTPPNTNIYHDKSHSTSDSYVLRDNINAKRIFDLFSGVPGNHTDFTGLLIVAWFQNSPQHWYDLFRTESTRLPYNVILECITGVPRQHASRFINCSLELFPNVGTVPNVIEQDLSVSTHEQVLRSLEEL